MDHTHDGPDDFLDRSDVDQHPCALHTDDDLHLVDLGSHNAVPVLGVALPGDNPRFHHSLDRALLFDGRT